MTPENLHTNYNIRIRYCRPKIIRQNPLFDESERKLCGFGDPERGRIEPHADLQDLYTDSRVNVEQRGFLQQSNLTE